MTVSRSIRDRVRERAGYACEFCAVTEVSSGGELTVDHFQPRAELGPDDLENLVYCCFRCNLYKAAWWNSESSGFGLWNPRTDSFREHFHVAKDGRLLALSEKGRRTVDVLRLNRPQLIEYRLRSLREHSLKQRIQVNSSTQGISESIAELREEERDLLERKWNALSDKDQRN